MQRAQLSMLASRLVGSRRFFKLPVPVPVEPVNFGVFKVYMDSNLFCWLVMDRPGKSENAIGQDFEQSIVDAVKYVEEQYKAGKCQVCIVTSAKKRFCVGADVTEFYKSTDKNELRRRLAAGKAAFKKFTSMTIPTIAAINGDALGGGLELALGCDYRVVADGKANLGLPEIMLGVIPGLGGTVRMPKLIGLQNSLTYILQGKNMKGDKAKKLGLVDAVLGAEDRYPEENRFFTNVRNYATKIANNIRAKQKKVKPMGWLDWFLATTPVGRKVVEIQTLKQLDKGTKGKYIAPYKAFESVMNSFLEKDIDKALEYESECFVEMCVSPQAKNQMSLFFLTERCKKLETQAAHFDAKDAMKVDKFAVLGAGVMGSGIAHWSAKQKKQVYMKDISADAVASGMKFVKTEIESEAKKKKMDKGAVNTLLGRVTGGVDNKGLKDCKVIVEAAVEVMSIKKKMVKELEDDGSFTNENIFATNTSALSINELAAASKYPANVVGMHFFNPVARMPLVEVIKGKETAPKATATVYKLALELGKFPVVCLDGPGFLVNRILGLYMSEAGRMLEEGCDPTKVDKMLLDFGMPMGPYRLLDEVGIDVAAHVGPTLRDGLGDRYAANEKLHNLINLGYLGKKNNKGFYKYNAKGKETEIDKELLKMTGVINIKNNFVYADVIDRCVLCMVNEASLVLAEGIALSPEDVDLGMVFGTGFAPFRGGLLSHADSVGIKKVVDRLNTLAVQYGERFRPSQKLQEMAASNTRFFPDRPHVPLVDGPKPQPKVKLF